MNLDEIMKNVNVNYHSSIQIYDYFFDPLKTENLNRTAKVIFLTHTHYDHLDLPSLEAVCDPNTTFVAPKDAKKVLEKNFPDNRKIYVSPFDRIQLEQVSVEVLPAYNLNKQFHKREYDWVGYKLDMGGTTFAVVGDTDATPELEKLVCDVLFVPIGGTFTMNATEAAGLVNKVMPKVVVPVHYNAIVGNKKDEKTFLSLIDNGVMCKIYL